MLSYILVLIFTLILSRAKILPGNFQNVREGPIIVELDEIYNISYGWTMEKSWFEMVNTTDQIQARVDSSDWYSHIKFTQWEELNPVSTGLWVLFYQELPPEFDIGPPFIANKAPMIYKNMHNLYITYFMYGSCTMNIYAEGVLVGRIDNPCGTKCSFDFFTAKVPLNDVPYAEGKTNFQVIFNATKPGDFLIVDRMEVDSVVLTTPTPCDCRPCNQILDENSKESLDGWEITGETEYFVDIEDIEDDLSNELPLGFNYTSFANTLGIWVVRNKTENPDSTSSFTYIDLDYEFEYVEITCYLHQDSYLSVYSSESTDPEIFTNQEDKEIWSVFRVDLKSSNEFRVEVNLTEDGYFAFVEKINARRYECPVPEPEIYDPSLTTASPEICVCPTTPIETTFQPPTRPSAETDETVASNLPTTITAASTGSTENAGETPSDEHQATSPGPNGENNVMSNFFLIVTISMGLRSI